MKPTNKRASADARRRHGPPGDVDEYLARLPEASRVALERLRKIVRSLVPQATEVISYGLPTLRDRKMLV